MTIERISEPDVARWTRTVVPAAELAQRIAETEFVPRAMRGNAPAVAACIMYGDEIGVGPMTALQGVHVIDGRPFLSAELMRALVLAAGHYLGVVESSGTRCVVTGYRMHNGRPAGEPVTVEWTIEMARAAGLAGRGAWRTYPRALLVARASADLCRMAFPDVVRGLGHIPDAPEADDVADWREYAESLGPEPETPAPAPTETVQWKGAGHVLAEPTTPPAEPPPWETPADTTTPAGPDYPVPEPAPAPESPVPGDDEPVPAENPQARLVDDASVRRIMAAYGDLPYGPDRDTRLGLFTAIVGRPVESTKDLERMEGFRLLGALYDLKVGRTIAVDDGRGGWTIHAGTEPPEDE